MKRVLFVALLALALPIAAFADSSVDFSSVGGTLSGWSGGLTLTGSGLSQVTGLIGPGTTAGALGSVSLSTGALLSSVYKNGALLTATFAGGGSLVITGNGTDGIPSGVLFTGTFTGTPKLQQAGPGGGYILYGSVTGTLSNGTQENGTFSFVTEIAGHKGYTGQIGIGSGDINVSPIPEPGTLTLLGTGLLGLVGAIRRKLAA